MQKNVSIIEGWIQTTGMLIFGGDYLSIKIVKGLLISDDHCY